MVENDSASRRERWELRHRSATGQPQTPSPLVTQILRDFPPHSMHGDAMHDDGGACLPRASAPRALDLAAGAGRHTVWLSAEGYDVTAVDYAPSAVGRIRAALAGAGVPARVECADLATWASAANPGFDLILSVHFYDPGVLRRAVTWLRPGGMLLLVTYAPGSPSGPANPAFRPSVGEAMAVLAEPGIEFTLADERAGSKSDANTVVLVRRD